MSYGSGRLNAIVSPGAAARMAARSEPAPLSALLVTVTVAAEAGTPVAKGRQQKLADDAESLRTSHDELLVMKRARASRSLI